MLLVGGFVAASLFGVEGNAGVLVGSSSSSSSSSSGLDGVETGGFVGVPEPESLSEP